LDSSPSLFTQKIGSLLLSSPKTYFHPVLLLKKAKILSSSLKKKMKKIVKSSQNKNSLFYKKSGRGNKREKLFIFYAVFKEVSHKIKGLRSLSIDQLLFLKRAAFSFLKRESKDIVTCRCLGASLLCSDKNFCFLVIF
jgi:hypothetical protein